MALKSGLKLDFIADDLKISAGKPHAIISNVEHDSIKKFLETLTALGQIGKI